MVIRAATIQFVQMLGAAIGPLEDAHTVMGLSLNLFAAFTGFLIPTSSIPAWWIWMFDVSYFKYAMHFLSAEEMEGEIFTCNQDQLVPVSDPASYSQWWQCPPSVISLTATGAYKCPIACGKELLNYYGVKYSVQWEIINFAVLHSFFIFFLIINFLCIKYINHVKR